MDVNETDTIINLGGNLVPSVRHCVGSTLTHSGRRNLVVEVVEVVDGRGSPFVGDVGVVEGMGVDVGGEEGCVCGVVGQGVGLARGGCGMHARVRGVSGEPYCCCSSLGPTETACVRKIRMNSTICDVW